MKLELNWHNRAGYALLMRLDKPVGIYLLLWPTLWALLLASQGLPSLHVGIVFILGVITMRSAGCIINDYADRNFDGDVERTKHRPLVSGQVTPTEALQLFSLLIVIAFLLVITMSWFTVLLSIPALLLASSYPFMKRYTHLPQVVLGAAFGWAIPMAIGAVLGEVPLWGWLLFFANLFWTVAYDTMYAMVDRNDDIHIGVKSTAILFGQQDRVIIALLQITTILLLAYVASILFLGPIVYGSIIAMAGFFIYQQVLIFHRDRDACFKAFLNNHYAGLVFTLGIGAHYLLQ